MIRLYVALLLLAGAAAGTYIGVSWLRDLQAAFVLIGELLD